MLDAEADEITGAARYERSAGRKAYRAGHYERDPSVKAGRMSLKVPKLKGAIFSSAVIDRYRRREESVEEALIAGEGRGHGMESRKLREAARCLREGIGETTTSLLDDYPREHRRRIRTNNMIERLNREVRRRTRVVGSFPDGRSALMLVCCLCSISCCGFSHDDFSGLGRACRPRNGLNWMVLVSPPERTGKDYDQHAPSTVYPSFAAERGIRRVDRAENTCQRADGA